MRISDIITNMIISMLDESEFGSAEIQRNELAETLGCVPSQINYVLSSRFTPENGYIIESRRGGGGFIKITRVRISRSSTLMHIINSIGSVIDEASARILIDNCLHEGVISENTAATIRAALSVNVFKEIPFEYRNSVRASLIKQMLVAQI